MVRHRPPHNPLRVCARSALEKMDHLRKINESNLQEMEKGKKKRKRRRMYATQATKKGTNCKKCYYKNLVWFPNDKEGP